MISSSAALRMTLSIHPPGLTGSKAAAGRTAIIRDLGAIRGSIDPQTTGAVAEGSSIAGGSLRGTLEEAQDEWLGGAPDVDEDMVEYSLRGTISPFSRQAPSKKGIEIVDLQLKQFEGKEAVELTFKDLATSTQTKDRLVAVEKAVLTDRRDMLRVKDTMLQTPLWIDMGAFAEGSVSKDDWDEVSYQDLSHGITMVNGATRMGSDNGEITGGFFNKIATLVQLVPSLFGFPPGLLSFGFLETNDALRVSGAEKITGTEFDDHLWFGDVGFIAKYLANWPSDGERPRFGEIDGAGGNDIIFHRGAKYVGSGGTISEALGGNADGVTTAAAEFRLTLKGGAGDDRLISYGGVGTITVGGDGTDFLFNTAEYGQLYGGNIDGQGTTDTDIFWYWPGTFIMDAGPEDILEMFGLPLLGGSNSVAGIYAGDGSMAIDWLFWFVFYAYTNSGQLIVYNAIADALDIGPDGLEGIQVVEDYHFGGFKPGNFGRPAPGDLGMSFRIAVAKDTEGAQKISIWNFVWGSLLTYIDVFLVLTKLMRWLPANDPLIIDLDGDGIETVSQSQSGVHFDIDGDFFAEQTGWVRGMTGSSSWTATAMASLTISARCSAGRTGRALAIWPRSMTMMTGSSRSPTRALRRCASGRISIRTARRMQASFQRSPRTRLSRSPPARPIWTISRPRRAQPCLPRVITPAPTAAWASSTTPDLKPIPPTRFSAARRAWQPG